MWRDKRERLQRCLGHMQQVQLDQGFQTWHEWLAEEVCSHGMPLVHSNLPTPVCHPFLTRLCVCDQVRMQALVKQSLAHWLHRGLAVGFAAFRQQVRTRMLTRLGQHAPCRSGLPPFRRSHCASNRGAPCLLKETLHAAMPT